ncbi:MAG: GTPase HflX [Candidatus Neomarinimicrobiota bacterium]|nr:GTPase HflX [Candidatus Neomarinimicrobiota bacterium]
MSLNHQQTIYEKAVLVGVTTAGLSREVVEEHLDELQLLAETAGAESVGRFTQNVSRISPKYFIGKGKAQQIVQQAKALAASLIIFDEELSPTQMRNYHKLAESVKVIDRTALILDIFTQHARTREAKTQVELARLQYMLPRLTRMWTHLERQMGGIGTRAGAGETQIEVDRRLVRDRISKLKTEMKRIERERTTQSKRRREKFRVSLVGYTNAGKSTMLKALTGADVYIKDQLFATLDTTIRSLALDKNREVLISDSVGLIRKLPHGLVASFRSTLREAVESDLLVIVADVSAKLLEEQMATVREVIASIGAGEKDSLLVLNKTDLLPSEVVEGLRARFKDAVFISALDHSSLDPLRVAIAEVMEKSFQMAEVVFEPKRGKEISSVYDAVEVLERWYAEDGVHLKIMGDRDTVGQVVSLAQDWMKLKPA